VDLVLAGVDPIDAEALELLTFVRRRHRTIPVILLFPRLHPERANEAMKLGAMAVLKYPVPAAELRATVLQAALSCESRLPQTVNSAKVTGAQAGNERLSAATATPVAEPGPLPSSRYPESNGAAPIHANSPAAVTTARSSDPAVETGLARRIDQVARE